MENFGPANRELPLIYCSQILSWSCKVPVLPTRGQAAFLRVNICQDPLKNYFGCQRQRGATSDNLNVVRTKYCVWWTPSLSRSSEGQLQRKEKVWTHGSLWLCATSKEKEAECSVTLQLAPYIFIVNESFFLLLVIDDHLQQLLIVSPVCWQFCMTSELAHPHSQLCSPLPPDAVTPLAWRCARSSISMEANSMSLTWTAHPYPLNLPMQPSEKCILSCSS